MAGASLAAAPRARAGKVSPVARPGRTMPRLPLSLTPPRPLLWQALPTQFSPSRIQQRPQSSRCGAGSGGLAAAAACRHPAARPADRTRPRRRCRPERGALQTCATMAKDFSNKASAAEVRCRRPVPLPW